MGTKSFVTRALLGVGLFGVAIGGGLGHLIA